MNISGVGNVGAPAQPVAVSGDKRAQLQLMLLKKSLEMHQTETVAVMQQTEGKGQTIDIRV